jgi:hypothetical protein
MVYNNGIVTAFPTNTDASHIFAGLFIDSKEKFYFGSDKESHSSAYFIYDNGSLRSYTLSEGRVPYLFGRVNNYNYFLARSAASDKSRYIYKITGTTANLVFAETIDPFEYEIPKEFTLYNGFVRRLGYAAPFKFYVLSDGTNGLNVSWNHFTDYHQPGEAFELDFISGYSGLFFSAMKMAGDGVYSCILFTESNSYRQLNFPAGIRTADTYVRYEKMCTYGKSIYFIFENGGKLLKGAYIPQP